MRKLKKISASLEIFLKVLIFIAILFLLLLFNICRIIGLRYDLFVIMIYPCGIAFIIIMSDFISVFKEMKNNNPFSLNIVKRFKNSMILSFIISILVIIALLFTLFVYNYYSLQLKVALVFISILFFMASIGLYILSVLFQEAHKYKEENDLTI